MAGIAYGAFNLRAHGSGDLFSHGLAHDGFYLRGYLFAHGGLDLLTHQFARASFHLLAYFGLHGGGHFFGHLLLRAVVNLLHNLAAHGGIDLAFERFVCLFKHIVLHVGQQLVLQAFNFFGVVVGGQRMQLNVQLLEVGFLFLQAFVRGFHNGVCNLARAVHQIGAVFVYFIQTILELHCAVLEFARTIVELLRAVKQLIHGVGQLVAQLIGIEIQRKVVVHIQIIEDGADGHGVSAVKVEIMYVGTDAGRGGNIRIKVEVEIQIVVQLSLVLVDAIFVFIQIQRFAQARQTVADHQRAIADVDHAAVGYLDVIESFIIRQHYGGHQEGQRQRYGFAVYLAVLTVVGTVFNVHDQVAAFAAELRGGDFLSIQRVADGNASGQLFGAGAFVADVLAFGVPHEYAVVVFEGFIAAHILDVLKAAVIRKPVLFIAVVEMLAHGNATRDAVGIRQHIHHFFLVFLGNCAGDQRREQHNCRHRCAQNAG